MVVKDRKRPTDGKWMAGNSASDLTSLPAVMCATDIGLAAITAPPQTAELTDEPLKPTFPSSKSLSRISSSGSIMQTDLDKAHNQSTTHLKPHLSVVDGVSIIVGIIVGSGIFVSPKGVLMYSGSVGLSLLIWLICGTLVTIGSLCYCELGTMIPQSGGDYSYILHAYGPLPAFLYMWAALIVILPAANAITALTFASYVLQPFWGDDCQTPDEPIRLIAIVIIALLTFINCTSIRTVTLIQSTFSVAKVLALVVIIGCGIVWLGMGNTEKFNDPLENTNWKPSNIALAVYSGIFSYAGWNFLNFVTEEIENPSRDLPLSIYISLPFITLVYLLTNTAYFAVLTPTEILSSSAVAVTFGNKLLGPLSFAIPLFVACSTFGGSNGAIFTSSRIFFVGARNGHMPRMLNMINIYCLTPIPSLVFMCTITIALICTNDVYELINYAAFMETLFITLSISALIYLRFRCPDLPRPVKVPIVLPILFLIFAVALLVLPIWTEPHIVLVDLGVLLVGGGVYALFIAWKSKPKLMLKFVQWLNLVIQKTFMAVEENN